MAATDQAMPIPRKTLTALLPVTFPMEASAYVSWTADTLLAKVSVEKEVRMFTKDNDAFYFMVLIFRWRMMSCGHLMAGGEQV